MKKKVKLTTDKERAVISDVLPYEIPLTFSNRYFYDFLKENSVEYKEGGFEWYPTSSGAHLAIQLFLGIEEPNIEGFEKKEKNKLKFQKGLTTTIPFTYGITHKMDELRVLSFAHPRNQIRLVSFYDNYKDLLIYHCQKSKFSLRAPYKPARLIYWESRNKLAKNEDYEPSGLIEEYKKEYSSLKSFFVYKKYSNIFKFFESVEYHQCEKKYNNLARLDISKCFDSIYTHSIAWSVFGKETVKDVMAGTIKGGSLKGCFPEEFDELMRSENYGETNGILIGPETSRIFAEIILQKIDKNVYEELDFQGVFYGVDYEIFRYVDDYFVFYNKEDIYKKILSQLQASLKEYKLNLNTEKEKIYQKPIITEITIAKKQISNLLNEKLKYEIAETEVLKDGVVTKVKHGHIFIKSSPLITEFKKIIKTSGVEYKDILNYSLAVVESRLRKIIDNFKEIDKENKSSKSLYYAIISIIEFSFFIYSVSPRVNTTVKLVRVLYVIISFLREKGSDRDYMDAAFKQVFENIYFIANKINIQRYTQVETLYLLTVLSELGKDYRVEEQVLAKYFGGKKDEADSFYVFDNSLNLFSITVALFYIGNKKRYDLFRHSIERYILDKMKDNKSVLSKDTEKTILLFDCLACPYIRESLKKELLLLFGVKNEEDQEALINLRTEWFTTWIDFDFGKELDAKRSFEVY